MCGGCRRRVPGRPDPTRSIPETALPHTAAYRTASPTDEICLHTAIAVNAFADDFYSAVNAPPVCRYAASYRYEQLQPAADTNHSLTRSLLYSFTRSVSYRVRVYHCGVFIGTDALDVLLCVYIHIIRTRQCVRTYYNTLYSVRIYVYIGAR